jgi:hypothetical protein
MNPVKKDDLKNRYIEYVDRNQQYRMGKVTKITGRMITLKHANGVKKRIHVDNIRGCLFGKNRWQEVVS